MGDMIQRCAYCGTELTDGIPVCPHCGRDNSVPVLGGKKRRGSGNRRGSRTASRSEYSDEQGLWSEQEAKRRGAGFFDEASEIEEQDLYEDLYEDSGRDGLDGDSYYDPYDQENLRESDSPRRRGRGNGRPDPDLEEETAKTGTAGKGSRKKTEKSSRKGSRKREETGTRSSAEKETGERKNKRAQGSLDPAPAEEPAKRGRRTGDGGKKKRKGSILPVLAIAFIPIILLCILIPQIVRRLPDPSLIGNLPFMKEEEKKEEGSGEDSTGSPGKEAPEEKPKTAQEKKEPALKWENEAVEQAVRAAAEIPQGEITRQDLEKVTYLDLTNAGLKDFSVLKQFPALKSVDLTGNGINSLEAFSDMTQLEGLCLDDNQITDIQPLRNLTTLQRLYLRNNQISNIKTLETLTGLTQLYLDGNKITDISPLSKLESLGILHLGDNPLQGIEALSGLKNLEVLTLYSDSISDLKPLEGLTKMRQLNLWGNEKPLSFRQSDRRHQFPQGTRYAEGT